MKQAGSILIVDDNPDVLIAARLLLKQHYQVVKTTDNPFDIEAIISAQHEADQAIDVVLLDMNFTQDSISGKEGFYWLKKIMSQDTNIAVLLMTAYSDIQLAVEAIKTGASDFIAKPWQNEQLLGAVAAAFSHAKDKQQVGKLTKQKQALQQSIGNQPFEFLGQSDAMQQVFSVIDKAANTDANILISGESGTGKEVFARSIHEHSPRKDKPFVAINCASIPENLLESELFGYEKGAFTGANKTTVGKIETAQGGTLFLDEIGDMPIGLQAKMLRFLQERVIERVGGRNEIPVDIRVICATHRDLQAMVAQETFREDLYYRVGEMPIMIPPLRERDQDIILLARTFLNIYREEFKAKAKSFSETAVNAMLAHKWPGNIREMQNKLKSAVIMAEGTVIQPDDLGLMPVDAHDEPETLNLREVREIAESRAIRRAYQKADKNMSKTAELLGVTRPTLYSLIDKYHMEDIKNSD